MAPVKTNAAIMQPLQPLPQQRAGFHSQRKQDFESVVSRGRLANDLAWTIPIVLDVDKETAFKMLK